MAKKKKERWVIKVGSSMVTSGGAVLIRSWMDQVVKLRRSSQIDIVWVSSGAIASAVDRTAFAKSKPQWRVSEKQALSAIGQPILMDLYNLALHASGLIGAQVLLTSDDLVNRKRRSNFIATIDQLLSWDVIPILNENDAVVTDEIRFGDNDSLSAKVAGAIGASRLIILTDVKGLYLTDSRKTPDASLVGHIKKVTPQILKLAGKNAKNSVGTGGMFSKLKAADEAAGHKVETVLVKGDTPSILLQVAQGQFEGTVIEGRGRR